MAACLSAIFVKCVTNLLLDRGVFNELLILLLLGGQQEYVWIGSGLLVAGVFFGAVCQFDSVTDVV